MDEKLLDELAQIFALAALDELMKEEIDQQPTEEMIPSTRFSKALRFKLGTVDAKLGGKEK